MLIPLQYLTKRFKLKIRGVLHIGAHECEEQAAYRQHGVNNQNIYWVEAMDNKVAEMKKKMPFLQIYHCVVNDKDDKELEFKITNNGQSSSLLDLGTHLKHHPHVWVTETKKYKTKRLDTFIKENNIPVENLNFMNLDIQGTELKAMKSMGDHISKFDYIYTEVNTEHVYENCALLTEIDEYLGKYGFKRAVIRMVEGCGWGDAFYIK